MRKVNNSVQVSKAECVVLVWRNMYEAIVLTQESKFYEFCFRWFYFPHILLFMHLHCLERGFTIPDFLAFLHICHISRFIIIKHNLSKNRIKFLNDSFHLSIIQTYSALPKKLSR